MTSSDGAHIDEPSTQGNFPLRKAFVDPPARRGTPLRATSRRSSATASVQRPPPPKTWKQSPPTLTERFERFPAAVVLPTGPGEIGVRVDAPQPALS